MQSADVAQAAEPAAGWKEAQAHPCDELWGSQPSSVQDFSLVPLKPAVNTYHQE